jgi:Putative zinc-finger
VGGRWCGGSRGTGSRRTPLPPGDGGHVRMLLGVYVLGALPAEESERVAAHLRRCAQCGAECDEVAGVSVLMAMLTEEDLLDGLLDGLPGPDGSGSAR